MSSKSMDGVSAEHSDSKVSRYLVENPRMIGALFTIFFLLSQAGNVSAGAGATINGP